MPTPYIDPNIVFASDAPTQDKPPAFNNYVKGMDETRSNEGRPTIKQFNFIQQQNDFKFLYIHERGACLPFVEGFPYENNAIVFKDGLIQQKNGASWIIPFMRGSQNLAELTDVAQARTKLDVYSKSEALAKDSNLSELTDKAVARTNLGVYSKSETDSIAGTPNATETVAGKAKIATTAIAQAGTNDTDILTAKKLRDALNATGNAPVYACRAWVNFNGEGVVSVIASGNVSSVTDNGVGDYTLNFATLMPNANYSISSSSTEYSDASPIPVSLRMSGTTPLLKTTSAVRVSTRSSFNSTLRDINSISVQVFC